MPQLSPEERRDLLKRLNAVQGYLHLGMPMDAWEELECIPAGNRARPEVLKIRVDVCRALEKWELVAEVTRHLAKLEPEDSRHIINHAAAVRVMKGEQVAADILVNAQRRFPKDAIVAYNLACYRAATGRVAEAKELLKTAIGFDSSLRSHSLDDPDLAGLWSSI